MPWPVRLAVGPGVQGACAPGGAQGECKGAPTVTPAVVRPGGRAGAGSRVVYGTLPPARGLQAGALVWRRCKRWEGAVGRGRGVTAAAP